MGSLAWKLGIQIYDGPTVKRWLKLLCVQPCAHLPWNYFSFIKPISFSWHIPAAVLPGCCLPGQARLPREKNSSQRVASIFLVAVLPLNLPAEEMLSVLGSSPRYPALFTSSSETLLWWLGAVASPCHAQGPSSSPLAAYFLPSDPQRREQGDFLPMRFVGLLVCKFCGDV